ncbi:hypothetical protein [Methyloglobulus sp.]|uniref:hypothetical protein n=1 Tax=Methyloglobulus sp. TaxID=2518622 RepID=UPI0032B85A21
MTFRLQEPLAERSRSEKKSRHRASTALSQRQPAALSGVKANYLAVKQLSVRARKL